MDEYIVNAFNEYSSEFISESLKKLNIKNKRPIFCCIGSDLVLGDSLGPLTGTFLKKEKVNAYIYGTLNFPITAKEVETAGEFLRKSHPNSVIISIDAAVGNEDDVGLIKIFNHGIKPGLGVNKDLREIGDISIIGIVSKKTKNNFELYNLTRLNLIYKMSEKISKGILGFVNNNHNLTIEFNNLKKAE